MDGDEVSAPKVCYLNKIMHSIDCFYAVELLTHFSVEHPLGSILGRGLCGVKC